jgi:transposase-like protein
MDTSKLNLYNYFKEDVSNEYNKDGKRYNDDFKKMIVDFYHSGRSVKDLCSEYGVSNVTSIDGFRKGGRTRKPS